MSFATSFATQPATARPTARAIGIALAVPTHTLIVKPPPLHASHGCARKLRSRKLAV